VIIKKWQPMDQGVRPKIGLYLWTFVMP